MIHALGEVPGLSESWLSEIKTNDPELYDEMAGTVVIVAALYPVISSMPGGVAEALSELDLRGMEIGAFRFAPAPGENAVHRIVAYDALIRQDYDVEGSIVFIGDYGSGSVFASPEGVALLDPTGTSSKIRPCPKAFADS